MLEREGKGREREGGEERRVRAVECTIEDIYN